MSDGHRYIVKFADGGSAMRRYDTPLKVGGEIVELGTRYRVTRIERPRTPTGLGHATVTPVTPIG